jgi:hypothetical protein
METEFKKKFENLSFEKKNKINKKLKDNLF